MQFPGREDDPNRLSYNSLSEFVEQKHKFSAECGEKKRGRGNILSVAHFLRTIERSGLNLETASCWLAFKASTARKLLNVNEI